MKTIHYLFLLGFFLFILGCPSVDTPFTVTVTQLSNGSTDATITYPAAGNATLNYNISRFTNAYYYAYLGDPENLAVITVEFDICGQQNLGAYPSNVTVFYPQFNATKKTLLHNGTLNGCVHVNDSGLLNEHLMVRSNPLECCEREDVNKLEERYPKTYNTTEEVEIFLWDSDENISRVNYTCFNGDADRIAVGTPFVYENDEKDTSSIFNFTCPAYGAEGRYTVNVNRVYNGAIWADTPGYYVEVLIADGGNEERFLLDMNISSDSAGTVEISNITIKYNNRLGYSGNNPTSNITGSNYPWASHNSEITDSVLEAETDVDNSDFDNCSATGTIVENLVCMNSEFNWVELDEGHVENSTINYSSIEHFSAYNSNITNANWVSSFDAYDVNLIDGVVYSGTLIVNFSKYGQAVGGIIPLGEEYGCNGSDSKWVFDGLDMVILQGATLVSDNCTAEVIDSNVGLAGNANILGVPNLTISDNSIFAFYSFTNPLTLENSEFDIDENSELVIYNSTLILNNSVNFENEIRFWIVDNDGNLTFSNITDVYPEVWIVDNVSDSEVCLTDINFSSFGSDYWITGSHILGERFVSFNDTAMPHINETNATIVLYGITYFDGNIYYYENYSADVDEILENGVICNDSRCINVTYNAGGRMLTFDVPGLSSYALAPIPETSGEGGNDKKELKIEWEQLCPEEQVKVTATHKGEPVSGVELRFMQTEPYVELIESKDTNGEGTALFDVLLDGSYEIDASKNGYRYKDNPLEVVYSVCEPLPLGPEPEISEEIDETVEPVEEPFPVEELQDEPEPAEEVEETPSEEPEEESETEEAPSAEAEPLEEEPAPSEDYNLVLWILLIVLIAAIVYWYFSKKGK